jgi:thiol-disulfide isomerase/thioredoxin
MALFNLPHLGKKVKPKSKAAKKKPSKTKGASPQKKGRLIEFYGTECSHCIAMQPSIDRLERELGVKVEKIEVWHNEANARTMQKYDRGFCGGVPFFYNEATGEWICGETSYEDLKKWALGKKK